MMLLLVKDVGPNRVYAGFADAERSVAGLPCEILEFRPALVNPARGIGFDQAGDVRDGMGRGHSNQEMNVVGHSIDAECDTPNFADDPTKVGMEIRLNFRIDQRLSVMGAEDEMD